MRLIVFNAIAGIILGAATFGGLRLTETLWPRAPRVAIIYEASPQGWDCYTASEWEERGLRMRSVLCVEGGDDGLRERSEVQVSHAQ